MTPELQSQFVKIVGDRHALRQTKDIAPFVEDARGRYDVAASMVLRPGSADEISEILKLATATATPVIPQGGNTGLVGAGLPLVDGSGEEIIISMGRMNQILDINPSTNTITAEAGAVLQAIQNAADDADRLFPLALGAQGSCQIGGNIGTNAGGINVLAYGNTRDLVMGLEVVLPNGDIWNGLNQLRKDNTGYDLKNLFIGAEGTLGIVTKVVLKLFPKPRGQDLAYVALNTPTDALELLNRAKNRAGGGLTGFELMNQRAMQFTMLHTEGARAPLSGEHCWYVLIEVSSGRSTHDAQQTMQEILDPALQDGVISDAIIAQSTQQQLDFWKLREDMSHAQRPEGASIKHDISVPVGTIPAFIEEADKTILAIVPEARIVNFGHMGDGNLHYNASQPVGWEAEKFFSFESKVHDAIYELIRKFDGSISAEHGVGQMKRASMAKFKDPTALNMMNIIKTALDPAGIMNPGKVI